MNTFLQFRAALAIYICYPNGIRYTELVTFEFIHDRMFLKEFYFLVVRVTDQKGWIELRKLERAVPFAS